MPRVCPELLVLLVQPALLVQPDLSELSVLPAELARPAHLELLAWRDSQVRVDPRELPVELESSAVPEMPARLALRGCLV